MRSYRDIAADLLYHYITIVMEKSGLTVSGTTRVELDELIDALIQASAAEVLRRQNDAMNNAKVTP